MDRPTPRVNAARLAECSTGKTVRLIGKVVSLDDSNAILESSDGADTQSMQMNTLTNTFVEIIGKVTGTDSMSELSSCNMGENIDMVAVNKVVELTHQYPDVFPSE
ncbi:hypothetical protein JCM8547_006799 [Rhodosporidiobolus lusitaniae]